MSPTIFNFSYINLKIIVYVNDHLSLSLFFSKKEKIKGGSEKILNSMYGVWILSFPRSSPSQIIKVESKAKIIEIL